MLEAACRQKNQTSLGCYELSVGNPDKGIMPIEECRRRVQQFIDANLPVLVTKVRHELFKPSFFVCCITCVVSRITHSLFLLRKSSWYFIRIIIWALSYLSLSFLLQLQSSCTYSIPHFKEKICYIWWVTIFEVMLASQKSCVRPDSWKTILNRVKVDNNIFTDNQRLVTEALCIPQQISPKRYFVAKQYKNATAVFIVTTLRVYPFFQENYIKNWLLERTM